MSSISSCLGRTPRDFAIDPSGRFLLVANQDSDAVVVFRIDPESGKLADSGQRAEIGTPMCVKFARFSMSRCRRDASLGRAT